MSETQSPVSEAIRNFTHVFRAEWDEIRLRRRAESVGYRNEESAQTPTEPGVPRTDRGGHPREDEPPRNLAGLALSGGGIRSATFCLGLLQGLHGAGLLRVFDYLSTVSGGGYVGGWWSAWLSRTAPDNPQITDPRQRGREDIFPPPEKLAPFTGIGQDVQPEAATGGVRRHKEAQERMASYKNISPEDFKDRGSAGNDPIHHLRLFGNYLTPRKGALSADTWQAITVISRNLFLTWLILLPVIFAAVLLGQLYFVAQLGTDGASPASPLFNFPSAHNARPWLFAWPLVGIVIWIVALVCAWMINSGASDTSRWVFAGWSGAVVVGLIILLAALVWLGWSGEASQIPRPTLYAAAAWLIAGVILVANACRLPDAVAEATQAHGERTRKRREVRRNRIVHTHSKLLVALVLSAAVLALSGFGHVLVEFLASPAGVPAWVKKAGGWGAILLAVGGSIYTALKTAPSGGHDGREVDAPSLVGRVVFTVTPPLVLVVLAVLACWLAHSFLGQAHARYGGPGVAVLAQLLSAATCLGVVLSLYFALVEMKWKGEKEIVAGGRKREVKPWPHGVLAGLVVVLAGIALVNFLSAASHLAARFVPPVMGWGVLAALKREGLWRGSFVLFLLLGFAVCALFFILRNERGEEGDNGNSRAFGLALSALAVICVLMALAGLERPPLVDADRLRLVQTAFGLMGTLLTWLVAIGWMADPNAISLHLFYKGRLARAYLGASNLRRGEDLKLISEASEGDDVALHRLRNCDRGGPYHLVNTTLNLVGGRDLATAQRSSDYFTLSKRYCGSSRTNYLATDRYMDGRMTLGTAVAVSGAAASPNMGAMTLSATLAMLMTFLNVRLGFWAPTPSKASWRETSARLWPFYVLREFLSQTNDLSAYCYLTDGGHFDNTGLYSLVARACRFIVVADCGADPRPCFSDLGTAIRRCRIDFNADIRLDLKEIERRDPKQNPAATFAVGTIKYDLRHLEALVPPAPNQAAEPRAFEDWYALHGEWLRRREGVIVVIKPALTSARDEAADVRQYAMENSQFPQQSTADFWYDEAQFESYRRLGEHCADLVFGEGAWPGTDIDAKLDALRDKAGFRSEDVKAAFEGMRDAADLKGVGRAFSDLGAESGSQ